jgi:acyl-coenzyme A synthetase/AMP-(fatty) acid ligase
LVLYFRNYRNAKGGSTHAVELPLGHLTTAAWIGLKAGDKHFNISQPGWAKFAWSCVFAPLNVGATVFAYVPKRKICSKQLSEESYRIIK